MIPRKVQSNFQIMRQKMRGDNTFIEGIVVCCNSHEFEVRVAGKTQYSLFSGMHLFPENERMELEVCCKKCGKVISVFDSYYDGYEQCGKKCGAHNILSPLICKKCKNNNFSVEVKYEYPDIQEISALEIAEIDNAYTWIWVTLKCNKCGAEYKHFIDFETA